MIWGCLIQLVIIQLPSGPALSFAGDKVVNAKVSKISLEQKQGCEFVDLDKDKVFILCFFFYSVVNFLVSLCLISNLIISYNQTLT